MGFEDFFENDRNHHRSYGKQRYNGDHNDSHHEYQSHHGMESHFDWTNVLTKVRNNKKLKGLVILSAILILSLAIFLIIALLPILGKIFTYITQLDLKGLQEFITGLLDKILKA
jgi:uncharacterized membrane protein